MLMMLQPAPKISARGAHGCSCLIRPELEGSMPTLEPTDVIARADTTHHLRTDCHPRGDV